jgi:hypothetical protein
MAVTYPYRIIGLFSQMATSNSLCTRSVLLRFDMAQPIACLENKSSSAASYNSNAGRRRLNSTKRYRSVNLTKEHDMSFWNILGRLAISDEGETIQRVSDTMSVSSRGTTYIRTGSTTVGSDGSVFTQVGNSSSDGSTRIGSTATGLGAVFSDSKDDWT